MPTTYKRTPSSSSSPSRTSSGSAGTGGSAYAEWLARQPGQRGTGGGVSSSVRENLNNIQSQSTSTSLPSGGNTYTGAQRVAPQVPRPADQVFVNTSTISGIGMASDPYSGLYTRDATVEESKSQFHLLPAIVKEQFGIVADTMRFEPSWLWNDMVELSKQRSSMGIYQTPLDLFYEIYGNAFVGGATPELDSSGGGGYYGGGGYGGGGGGSAGQVNLSNEEDARAVINQLATQMLGRTVSEREFKKYFQALRDMEMANPQTVRMDVDADGNPITVVEGGLGAEGRQAAMEDSLRGAKDYNEYTIGSRAVGLMGQYLQERGVFSG